MAIETRSKMGWLLVVGLLLAACGGEELDEAQIQMLDPSSAGTLQRRTAVQVKPSLTTLPIPTRDFDSRSKPLPIPLSPQDPIPIALEENDVVDAGTLPRESRPRKRRADPEEIDLETAADRHRGY